jgi:PadR family transcriptional regulator PadR
MVRGPQMTMPVLRVLSVLLEDPEAKRYGLDISAAAGLHGGTVYPILMRLEQAGWLASDWEEVNPTVVGRPRRRFYRLTAEGVRCAHMELAEARQALVPTGRLGHVILDPGAAPI